MKDKQKPESYKKRDPKKAMENKIKKVKKCLTETIEHDKLEKSPREADKKSYKKR